MSDKPPIVHDYKAIAQRMEQLSAQHQSRFTDRCANCNNHGWVQGQRTKRWMVCAMCCNPHGLAKPYEG